VREKWSVHIGRTRMKMTLNFILAAPEAKSPINNALKIEGNFVFN
jgi:hypothetical protein